MWNKWLKQKQIDIKNKNELAIISPLKLIGSHHYQWHINDEKMAGQVQTQETISIWQLQQSVGDDRDVKAPFSFLKPMLNKLPAQTNIPCHKL